MFAYGPDCHGLLPAALLRQAGYEVLGPVASAAEALGLQARPAGRRRARPGPGEGPNGVELAQLLQAQHPLPIGTKRHC